jgi:hypothetical protein
MALVAFSALALTTSRHWANCEARAVRHDSRADFIREKLPKGCPVWSIRGKTFDDHAVRVIYHRRKRNEWRRAAWRPWAPMPLDPAVPDSLPFVPEEASR